MATTKATTEQHFHEEILWWDIIDERVFTSSSSFWYIQERSQYFFCGMQYFLPSDPVVLHLLVNWCVKIQYTIQ
jgi:hypothetical protein